MDRLDDLRAFTAAVEEGSLAAAGRKIGRSPPAMTRAIAGLEKRVGAILLERTTRIVRLTSAGEQLLAIARRILADYDEMVLVGADGPAPTGTLTVTAPLVAGAELLCPVVDAYLNRFPKVQVSLLLFDRVARLPEEEIDIALRIGHLPDSTLIAQRVGAVRSVVCASPAYLEQYDPIRAPSDLKNHRIIALAGTKNVESWAFTADDSSRRLRIKPRLAVTTVEAARASAIAGCGVVRLLSYQVAEAVGDGRLVAVLERHEQPQMPVHLIAPKVRLASTKARAFFNFAAPLLRDAFLMRELPVGRGYT